MATAKQAAPRSRKLTVTYTGDSKLPSFVFEGAWTGFEVSTVASSLRRAYLRMTRDQRRGVVSETSSNSTKEKEQ